jgi:hypothetical protein
MDAYDRCTNLGKKILPILLPSMVEAENFSGHPRTGCHSNIRVGLDLEPKCLFRLVSLGVVTVCSLFLKFSVHHQIRQRIAPRTHQCILHVCTNNPHAFTPFRRALCRICLRPN